MSTIAPALLLVAALRSGSILAERPGASEVARRLRPTADGRTQAVAHICRTSRLRPTCGARTRRLALLPDGIAVLGQDRRVCRRCTARLAGGAPALVSRGDWAAEFSGLTLEDFAVIVGWARTVEESHQISFVMTVVCGPDAWRPTTPEQIARREVENTLTRRRRELVAAERTPEEAARILAAREAEAYDREVIARARARDAAVDRAMDRRARNRYLAPWERDLLDTA